MEPNNNKKRLISVLIVLGLILLTFMCWMIFKKSKPQVLTPTQQVSKDAKEIFSVAKLTFPKIIKLVPLAAKDVPADIQIFSLAGATGQVYNTIQYENNKTGYQTSYLVPNFTMTEFMSALPKQVTSTGNKSSWIMQNGTRTDIVGYLEFVNNTSKDQARVTFFQQGNGVKVVLQSLKVK